MVSKGLPLSSPVGKAATQEVKGTQKVESSASSVSLPSLGSLASSTSPVYAAVTLHSADASLAKLSNTDVSTKPTQPVDTTSAKRDSVVDASVGTSVQRNGTDQSSANGGADAGLQATSAGQTSSTISAQFQRVAQTVNVQSTAAFQNTATSSSGKAESAITGANQISKVSTSGQAVSASGSSMKGKDASSDLRDKRGDSSSDSGNATVQTSVVAKVSETTANAGQGSNAPAGGGDRAAIQTAVTMNQTVVPDHGQPASGQTASIVPSNTTHTQGVSPGPASNLPETPGVSSAQLTQSMHHSEMRLGMQSAEFGDISISTSINHQALSAQISIDHSELGKALAVHLPAIEAKLGSAYGLEARVEVRDGSSSSPSYSNSGQQSKERSQSQAGSAGLQTGIAARTSARNESTTSSVAASTSRLDIRI
jgi:hypothetical protein